MVLQGFMTANVCARFQWLLLTYSLFSVNSGPHVLWHGLGLPR